MITLTNLDEGTLVMRVGFDLSAAGPRFTRYIREGAAVVAKATGGLRMIDVTLGAVNTHIPERKLTFLFVELIGSYAEIAEQVRQMVPLDHVAPAQFEIEVRNPLHLHVQATSISTWLVCRGEAMPPVSKLPPNTPGSPAGGDAGSASGATVVQFRQAA